MAKNIIPDELDLLIREYLTDGVITAKERDVLLRKAQRLGLDVDEVDLYIDAQQQKADQEVDSASNKRRGQSCPFCGGGVPQLAEKCPHCGEHLTVEASSELKEIIDNLEEALVDLKGGNNYKKSKATVERYIRKAEVYYGSNPKIIKLVSQIKKECEIAEKNAKSDAKKRAVINLLTKHKVATIVVLSILFLIVIGIIDSIQESAPTNSTQGAIEQINSAIEAGDLSKAEGYYFAYKKKHGSRDLKSSANKLAKAFIKNGDYDAAEGMLGQKLCGCADDINWIIQDELIKAGEYQRAEACIDWCGATDKHYNFLCKCIDQMNENGDSKSKIKSFIDRTTTRYTSSLTHDTEWQQPAVKSRLYEYAGI